MQWGETGHQQPRETVGDPATGRPRPSFTATSLGRDLDREPPIDDPYLGPSGEAPPPPRFWRSSLAFGLGCASLVLGPLVALPALVFGVLGLRHARRLAEDGHDVGRAVRQARWGIVAGLVWILAGALVPAGYWFYTEHGLEGLVAAARPPVPAPRKVAPMPEEEPPPDGTVPQTTLDQVVGKLHVVTLGVKEPSLAAALTREAAAARAAGREVLVTTTRGSCEPCDGFRASLSHDLMQTALEGSRVVIVDVDVFGDDLDLLGIEHDVLAGFFLLTPGSTPRDAIHGGEWGEDIAANIAPVIGPFVRGKLDHRKFDFRIARRFPPTEQRPPGFVGRPRPQRRVVPPVPTASGVWL